MPPVRLDPFQNITNVGWGGFYYMGITGTVHMNSSVDLSFVDAADKDHLGFGVSVLFSPVDGSDQTKSAPITPVSDGDAAIFAIPTSILRFRLRAVSENGVTNFSFTIKIWKKKEDYQAGVSPLFSASFSTTVVFVNGPYLKWMQVNLTNHSITVS